jgi:hypothetical protein
MTCMQTYALKKLHELVDQFWADVAAAVPLIEELSEDEAFPARSVGGRPERPCSHRHVHIILATSKPVPGGLAPVERQRIGPPC